MKNNGSRNIAASPADENTAFLTYQMLLACEEPGLTLMSLSKLEQRLAAAEVSGPISCATENLPDLREDSCNSTSVPAIKNQKSKIKNPTTSLSPSDGERAGERGSIHASRITHHFPSRHSSLYLGVDVARKKDLCVLDLGEKIGDVVWDRCRIELHGKTFSEIEDELYRLLHLPQLKRACIDATGLGLQLASAPKNGSVGKSSRSPLPARSRKNSPLVSVAISRSAKSGSFAMTNYAPICAA